MLELRNTFDRMVSHWQEPNTVIKQRLKGEQLENREVEILQLEF